MNLEQIKQALQEGKKVYWTNLSYEVIQGRGGLLLRATTGHCIGLDKDNIKEDEFFTK